MIFFCCENKYPFVKSITQAIQLLNPPVWWKFLYRSPMCLDPGHHYLLKLDMTVELISAGIIVMIACMSHRPIKARHD